MIARVGYAVAFMVMILLGLASRSKAQQLPAFVADHAGDALWAAMIYCGLRLAAIHKSMRTAALISLLLCFGVELSQLYQADWINEVRATTVGALVLGHGFLVIDLARYSAGILLAMLLDAAIHRMKDSVRPNKP